MKEQNKTSDKQNGYKQSIRYIIQNTGLKNAQIIKGKKINELSVNFNRVGNKKGD